MEFKYKTFIFRAVTIDSKFFDYRVPINTAIIKIAIFTRLLDLSAYGEQFFISCLSLRYNFSIYLYDFDRAGRISRRD